MLRRTISVQRFVRFFDTHRQTNTDPVTFYKDNYVNKQTNAHFLFTFTFLITKKYLMTIEPLIKWDYNWKLISIIDLKGSYAFVSVFVSQ